CGPEAGRREAGRRRPDRYRDGDEQLHHATDRSPLRRHPSGRHRTGACLRTWLAGLNRKLPDFAESWFYSDSHNDLPLLLAVTNPVAIDPDPVLAAEALSRGWPITSWR